jgi:site-specific DNA recombinase
MARYENATKKNYELGISILELAKKAHQLYLRQDHHERRKLLNTLLSNCTFSRGSLYPTYRKPFDILAKTDRIVNWRPQRDSNPCCRIESAVS